jgi:altronate hydrolase
MNEMRSISSMRGFARADGRVGIRNYLLVIYLVECAHHVARKIALPFENSGVQVIGFPGCYPSEYAQGMLRDLGTHPNVGAVLLVSLGCEEFRRSELRDQIHSSGRPVELLVIQKAGGTQPSVDAGRKWVEQQLVALQQAPTQPIGLSDLVIGTKCGGSDGLSGVTINPAVGRCFDLLCDAGATVMFEETCELIGCESHLADRGETPEVSAALSAAVEKAMRYHNDLGHGSFGGGNISHGLSTLEEKSLGAYSKSGSRKIRGVLKPGDKLSRAGLYLLDTVNDGPVRYGIPNINDTQTITEMVACGCHLILFTTGAGSVVGQAVAPVIKCVSNTRVFESMSGDMDINGGAIADGIASTDDVALEILESVISVASGAETRSESLGHQEFVLAYKTYQTMGPGCFPK